MKPRMARGERGDLRSFKFGFLNPGAVGVESGWHVRPDLQRKFKHSLLRRQREVQEIRDYRIPAEAAGAQRGSGVATNRREIDPARVGYRPSIFP